MSPCKDNNGSDESKRNNHLLAVGAIEKGNGVVKIEEADEGDRSNGKISTPQAVAAGRYGRSGVRHGDRELHVATERKRRKRMGEMFSKLHGLIPTLPHKVDKSSIVMEAINYIKHLEETLIKLENRKLDMQLAQGKVTATANGQVTSSVATLVPTDPVVPPPVILPGAGIGPIRAAPSPHATVAVVTADLAPVGLQTWSGPNVVLSLSGNDAYITVCVARRQGVFPMVMSMLDKHNINIVMSGISSDHTQTMFTIHTRISEASSRFGDNIPYEEIYKLAVSEIMVWLSA